MMQSITIETEDGIQLAADLFAEEHSRGVLIIAPAMAVRRHLYHRFAHFAAQQGLATICFDYRCSAGSLRQPIRQCRARLLDWGRFDLEAVFRWANSHFPGLPQYFVGHSVGGQLLPLADSAAQLRAIALVASQSGYWRHRTGLRGVLLAMIWYLLIPVVGNLLGYIPGPFIGGTPLAGGVATQWAKWGRHRNYILCEGDTIRQRFAAIQAPLVAYSFADDPFYAPAESVDALLRWFGSNTEHRHIHPAEVGQKRIGHFGVFRSQFKKSLWTDILAGFQEAK